MRVIKKRYIRKQDVFSEVTPKSLGKAATHKVGLMVLIEHQGLYAIGFAFCNVGKQGFSKRLSNTIAEGRAWVNGAEFGTRKLRAKDIRKAKIPLPAQKQSVLYYRSLMKINPIYREFYQNFHCDCLKLFVEGHSTDGKEKNE